MSDLPATVVHIFSRCVRRGACLIWTGASSRGHGQLTGGEYVHRVVYEQLKGPIPEGLEIGHTCDEGLCVEPEHLEAVTRQKNVQDAFSRGRYQRGRYSNEDIVALRAGKISSHAFAEKYGLSQKTAYNIKKGHKAKWRS